MCGCSCRLSDVSVRSLVFLWHRLLLAFRVSSSCSFLTFRQSAENVLCLTWGGHIVELVRKSLATSHKVTSQMNEKKTRKTPCAARGTTRGAARVFCKSQNDENTSEMSWMHGWCRCIQRRTKTPVHCAAAVCRVCEGRGRSLEEQETEGGKQTHMTETRA